MIGLIITLAILGLIVWLVVTFIPMPDGWKKAISIIALVCAIFYVLSVFGVWNGSVHDVPVPQLRDR